MKRLIHLGLVLLIGIFVAGAAGVDRTSAQQTPCNPAVQDCT